MRVIFNYINLLLLLLYILKVYFLFNEKEPAPIRIIIINFMMNEKQNIIFIKKNHL